MGKRDYAVCGLTLSPVKRFEVSERYLSGKFKKIQELVAGRRNSVTDFSF